MNKLTFIVLMAIGAALFPLSCASQTTGKTNKKKNMNTTTNEGKKLIAFFSHTGENYNVGYIEKGNTAIIAGMIAETTGADLFEIKPEKEYPKKSYNECIEVAKREKESNARPAIKGDVKVEDYDVIFLGYPNWWGDAPMCVYTFIGKHKWNGKTVIPFITHEGSGMGGTDRKIAAACKGADVAVGKGLAVQGKVAQEEQEKARRSVERWIEGLGQKK